MSRRFIAATAVIAAALAACSNNGTPVSYAPAAYGANGQCFYDQSPAEATALLAAGLCPAGWVPTPMPLAWQEEYYSYYSSPGYYNSYVPVSYRTVYVTHETTFHTTYATQINSASSKAVYKGSNGKTITGPKTGTVQFGGGSGRQQSFGGGSGRSNVTGGTGTSGGSKSTTGGSGSRSTSGGSSGGGSGRGGSSGGGTGR
jgi:hypothetical protein